MSTRSLPARPNLAQLKRQAHELRAAHRAGRPSPRRASPRTIPRCTGQRSPSDPRSAAARSPMRSSVIAREYGFDSWTQLKQRVELGQSHRGNRPPPAFRRGARRARRRRRSTPARPARRRSRRWSTRAPTSSRRTTTSPARRCCTTSPAIPIASTRCPATSSRSRACCSTRGRTCTRSTLGPIAEQLAAERRRQYDGPARHEQAGQRRERHRDR